MTKGLPGADAAGTHLPMSFRSPSCFMFTLAHQLLVACRIPLVAIVEYVEPANPMFCRNSRGRVDLFADFDSDVFTQYFEKRFRMVEILSLKSATGSLFLLGLANG